MCAHAQAQEIRDASRFPVKPHDTPPSQPCKRSVLAALLRGSLAFFVAWVRVGALTSSVAAPLMIGVQ